MNIAGLEKCSTLDFPGRLAAVVFSPGCNYRCYYCHNRGILGSPPLMDEAVVRAFLEKRAGMLEGVVFSGGEPTLQEDLPEWLAFAKGLGYAVKLDTNGSRPDALRAILEKGLADFVAMDVKAPLGMYPSICEKEADGVAQSIMLLASSGVAHEFRTTVVPQLTEKKLKELALLLPPGSSWALQLYREQPGDEARLERDGLVPYTPGGIKALAETLSKAHSGVFARC